jgi:anti-sigma factor RsiW
MDSKASTTENICPRSEISAYLDGELAPGEELALEAHVAFCTGCLAELNMQKQLLAALDSGLEKQTEIELPENFARVVAVRAESGVTGLRSREERFRALFLSVLLLLIVLIGLGAETGHVFTALSKIGEHSIIVVRFVGHLIFDLAIGTTIILRSLSGQFVFNSAISFVLGAFLFGLSTLLLSRLISRFNRS